DRLRDVRRAADVAGDDADAAARQRGREVVACSAREVVEHDDLRRACGHERVGDVRSDQAGTAGDEHAIATERGRRHARHWPSSTARRTRAGLPATIVRGGTSRVTTLPAPTIALSPISTPHRIVEPEPIEAPARTTVGTRCQSASVCRVRSALTARGYRSLMNVTPWPTKT